MKNESTLQLDKNVYSLADARAKKELKLFEADAILHDLIEIEQEIESLKREKAELTEQLKNLGVLK